jgi:K+/H+ antiporter YhaU regulatory subunit KhtT
VLLGVGVPSAALLRPLFGGPYVALAVALLLLLVAVGAWRSASRLDREVRSAAEAMAALVASQSADEPESPGPAPAPRASISGVANLHCTLATGMPAVGKTLASLDLRARTGAAVLAIHRQGRDVVIPTGSEPLGEGDVLILAGTPAALEQARTVLAGSGQSP